MNTYKTISIFPKAKRFIQREAYAKEMGVAETVSALFAELRDYRKIGSIEQIKESNQQKGEGK